MFDVKKYDCLSIDINVYNILIKVIRVQFLILSLYKIHIKIMLAKI